MPLRKTARLVEGDGTAASAKVAFAPSMMPEGRSPSTNVGDPPEPHVPDDPSTCMQSVGFPVADSTKPEASTIAVRPAANPGPLVGRAARSAIKLVTCDSGMGPVTLPPVSGAPAPDPTVAATRTSR